MHLPKILSLLAASALASSTVTAHHDDYAGAVIYVFDPDYAGGVSGTIQTFWEDSVACSRVVIKADLDFKRVDFKALTKADGNCTGQAVTEYKWHIHTKWNQPSDAVSGSASYAQCAKAITGNHYDPNKACGPASEYADSKECKNKIPNYNCTPQRYAQNAGFCEAGDLSGKYGSFKPNKKGVVKTQWRDEVAYPYWNDHKPQWNIVIHAVCGSATPRLACAIGTKSEYDDYGKRAGKHHDGEQDESEDSEENSDKHGPADEGEGNEPEPENESDDKGDIIIHIHTRNN